jgi:RNA polymerase sigma factor (sigma-70 family)
MSEAVAAAGFSRLLSDERLTRRAVGGDERAFAAIFRRYHQSLYRFCLAIVGNPEDAQDALQNTMIKVLRALPGEERKIELKPWLYRIAHNESIDLLRRRRETRELNAEQIAPGYTLAEDAATRERLRSLLADLKELPERQREALVMRELAGLDFEEIGAALDTSGAVARQTLYEARQSLRQMEEGREMSCDLVTRALSDGDGRVTRRRDVRAHLRTCAGCRRFRDEIKSRQHELAALSPLPAVAAAGMLQGLVGGSQAAGGGLAALLGGGAAKTIGASAAAKGVATAAVVAAVGVGAADRTGVIDLGLPGDKGAKSSQPAPGAGGVDAGKHHGGSRTDGDSSRKSAGARGEDAPGKAAPSAGSGRVRDVGLGAHPGKGKAHSRGQGAPVEHAAGRGHEKQHPEAATGGQETAAQHKPSGADVDADGKGGSPAVTPQPKPTPPAPTQDPPPKQEPVNPPAATSELALQPKAEEMASPEAASGHGKANEHSKAPGKKP